MKRKFLFVFSLLFTLLSFFTLAQDEIYVVHDLGNYKIFAATKNIIPAPHAAVYTYSDFGVMDMDGNCIIEPVYRSISKPVENRALFETDEGFGYFDENWNVAIQPVFDKAFDFSEGMARVAKEQGAFPDTYFGKKFGYIDYSGKLVIDYMFDGANDFHDGCAVVEKYEEGYNLNFFTSYGIINHQGTLVRDFVYNIIDAPYQVQMSENKICINESLYDNNELDYPFINHNGVTYMPLTFYTCMHMGFTTIWSEEYGVTITAPRSVPLVGGKNNKFGNFTGQGRMQKGQLFSVGLYKGKLTIAGKTYTAKDVYYPLLVQNNIVYIPVLWRQGMEAMGLDYTYDSDSKTVIINTK